MRLEVDEIRGGSSIHQNKVPVDVTRPKALVDGVLVF